MAKISMLLCFIVVAFSFGLHNVSAKNKQPKIEFFELRNEKSKISVNLTNWGATIVSLHVPDRNGYMADVVLGYDSIKSYQTDEPYLGAIVGRVANRIGKAQFKLNGKTYKLYANDGNNTLHGGKVGFSDVAWKVIGYNKDKGPAPFVSFSYFSRDGEEGYPGDLQVTVTYTLRQGDNLEVLMEAKTLNKATPVNLAQHTYWNLGGHNSGDILNNKVKIYGSQITVVDKELIPTGKFMPVKGTPYDLLEPRLIKDQIKKLPNGFDINYVLDPYNKPMKRAGLVLHRKSGRSLVVWTDAPGVQFYTGNFLKNVKGKGGFVYQAHAGLCLETQGFPDAVNRPEFPSTIVTKEKPYKHTMVYKFNY